MSLGQNLGRLQDSIAVARRAMDAGVWFHASPTYNNGFTFMILRMAFDEDRSKVPPIIIKIRDGSAELIRFEAEDTCRRLGIDGIDVAQLVSMERAPAGVATELVEGGPIADVLAEMEALRSD